MNKEMPDWAAIVLAAGRSERFGAPKVLQSFKGIPFLTRIRKHLQVVGIFKIVLVLGHQADDLVEQLPEKEHFKIVVNENYQLGQMSSLQKGLQAIQTSVKGVLMCLVDQPHVSLSVYQQLLQTAVQHHNQFLIPEFKGRGGHPIIIPADFFQEILDTDARKFTLKDVLRLNHEFVRRVNVNDSSILEDIDTKEMLKLLEKKYSK